MHSAHVCRRNTRKVFFSEKKALHFSHFTGPVVLESAQNLKSNYSSYSLTLVRHFYVDQRLSHSADVLLLEVNGTYNPVITAGDRHSGLVRLNLADVVELSHFVSHVDIPGILYISNETLLILISRLRFVINVLTSISAVAAMNLSENVSTLNEST